MTTKPTDIGPNRTGIAAAPLQGPQAVDSAREGTPNPSFDMSAHHAVSVSYSKEASPLGTLPPPATVKGVAKTAVQALKGHHASVFLDQIGERLAFERSGTRLYEALLARYDAADVRPGDPPRAELERIRDEELAHFHLLVKAMQKLGADPTAVTPSADVAAVASTGLLQVVADPRTTLTEGLKAILIAELADNDGWLSLADLADKLGHDELAADFRRALSEEDDHLARVRAWLNNAVQGQAGLGTPAAAPPQPGA